MGWNMKKYNPTIYVHIAIIVLMIFIRLLLGFTDAPGTTRLLTDQGYSNVEITGWRPFAGSKDDIHCTGFTAITPTGKQVSGTVTSGFFKGKTLRLD